MLGKIRVEKSYLLSYGWIILLAVVLLGGCSTITPEVPPAEDVNVEDVNLELETAALMPFKGNPNFSEAQLSTEMRMWYKRLWRAVKRSDATMTDLVKTGDVRRYGRDVNEHLTSLLLAFRATGDLRLLDEVDHYTQMMRGKLADAWRNGSKDGYLNWLYLHKKGDTYGTDTDVMNEIMAHSLVAAYTYAFKVNENLKSPSGVNYKERAAFWQNYLDKHFEAKWRKRNRIASAFPFLKTNTSHAYTQWMRYHYYMYKLTGKQGYLSELGRMGQTMKKEYKEVNTPSGIALVFDHTVVSEGRKSFGLQPTIYAKYQSQAATDLYFEGVAPFDNSFMQKFARTFSRLVLDGDPKKTGKPMAIDVGGTVDLYTSNQVKTRDGTVIKADLKWLKSKGFNRWSNSQYGYWPITGMAAFDSSNKIKTATEKIYSVIERNPEDPRWVSIPAGIVIALANK